MHLRAALHDAACWCECVCADATACSWDVATPSVGQTIPRVGGGGMVLIIVHVGVMILYHAAVFTGLGLVSRDL